MIGQIGILSVGAGDTKLSFDPTKPAEAERAARVVSDMLRRGYAILVQVGEKDGEPLYQRAKAFDPKTCEYIIVGAPDEEAEKAAPAAASTKAKAEKPKRGRPRLLHTRVSAATTRAVSVAPSAGG